VPADIRKTIDTRSSDEQAFVFSMRQMIVTSLAVTEALGTVGTGKARQMIETIARRISDGFYTPAADESDEEAMPHQLPSQSSPAAVAYQLKITLEGSKPPIWRRILVADCTLDVLHEIIQTAMGWEDYHLHQFQWGKDRFSPPNADLGENDYDETRVLVSQLASAGCKKLRYWYDFGDDWWHTIKIEKTLTPKPADRFPTCTDGAGACPPEDCGGVWGYYEILEAIRDPKHEQHEEFLEWLGDDFDPQKFDLDEVNEVLAG
jgi:hypothetical protein